MNDDERLKQTFEKLRKEDARGAPSFEAIRQRRPRRASPWAMVVPIASALAAAAVVVVWCNAGTSYAPPAAPVAMGPATPQGGEVAPPVPALEDAPLDFLLDVPLLRGAPKLETSLLQGSLR